MPNSSPPVEVRFTPMPIVASALTTESAAATLPVPPHFATSAPTMSQMPLDGLTGSIGYSLPWGNCVAEPGVNNPGWGNPIVWPVLYYQPHIGATVLFTWNHTAVVSGIWSNGDIEVRQQNTPGMTHRIPTSWIRGFR